MFRELGKKILKNTSPAYRVTLRLEEENSLLLKKLETIENKLNKVNTLLNQYGTQNQMFFWWQLSNGDENIEEIQKRFYLNMPKAGHDLRMVQLGNAFLLSKLEEICRENDIHFWLDFGNLLGAVRHKGFIPWDDDLDVGIMRKDLEKLRTVMKNYPDFRLADGYYISNTVGRFTRFIVNDYSIPSFVDLDVFDYCNLPDNNETWDLICTLRKKFVSELTELKSTLKENYNIPNAVITPQNPEDIKKINEVCNRYSNILGEEDEAKTIFWAIDNTRPIYRALIDKDIVFPLGKLEYEKGMYGVPRKWDDYLKKQYQNYYQLPANTGTPKHRQFAQYDNYIDAIERYLKKHNTVL